MTCETRGYSQTVARSPKVGAATVAALFSLIVGAEVASAGLIDEVVEDPAAIVENPVPEVTQAADDAVADAKQAVEEAVADAPATADAVVETAKDVVADTPAAPVVDRVEKAVDPVARAIDPVVSNVAEPAAALTGAAGRPSGSANESLAAAPDTAAGETAEAATTNVRSGTESPLPPAGLAGEAGDALRPISASSSAVTTSISALATGGLRELSLPRAILPAAAPEPPSDGREGSSNAPWAPFAPLFPADTPATAAAAGATGAALVAALLTAFMLLAPRTGRLARPGPILVRPDPCLSLSERPG